MSNSLLSPGVQVTVTDETAYTTAPTGSVPFILLATAQNKNNQSGALAPYTTANTSGQLYLETSQRSLVNDFGAPIFQNVQGTPVNAGEQNEYGLATAYAALAVSDAAYIMRANVDLGSIGGSLTAPSANVPNGTYWLDTTNTQWGIQQYNAASQSFAPVQTSNQSGNLKLWVITNPAQTVNALGNVYLGYNAQPSANIGKPGDYAVVACNSSNPVWFQSSLSGTPTWYLVGSQAWQSSVPTVTGNVVAPSISVGGNLIINGTNIALGTGASLSTIVANINAFTSTTNVAAATWPVGQPLSQSYLVLTANAVSNGNGTIIVNNSVPTIATDLGIGNKTYPVPQFQASPYYAVPHWLSTDTVPAPSGSVWMNMSSQQYGANVVLKQWNTASGVWTYNPVAVWGNEAQAGYWLDPKAGGFNIPLGSFYLEVGAEGVSNADLSSGALTPATATSVLMQRSSQVAAIKSSVPSSGWSNLNSSTSNLYIVTANVVGPAAAYTVNTTVAVHGSVNSNLVAAINSKNISGIQAGSYSNGYIYIENVNGQTFYMYDGYNTPLANVGINVANVSNRISGWTELTEIAEAGGTGYVVGGTAPISDPANGTQWYYNDYSQVDLLINNGTNWVSYRTLSSDARGYNLTLTDPNGPIVSATAPVFQSTGNSVVSGDIWVNTSDLTQLPNLWRYNGPSSSWTQINNTDHTSTNGIIFADARWSDLGNQYVDPGQGNLVPISTLVNYANISGVATLDPDAPAATLYPRGMLLFNTRRSGFNIKQYQTNIATFVNAGLTYTSSWVTSSGNDYNGVAIQGSEAQRGLVVQSLISAVENSTQLLDTYYNFNLMACPGYPELLPTLVNLNEARGETAFIVGDSPLTLPATGSALTNWANNTEGAPTDDEDSLVTFYDYASVYYPSGYTTDLSGNPIAVPSSYMALPTIIQSDNVSYPWFAPAGATRGQVNNVSAIGYVDSATGDFVTNSIPQGLRDVLYPLGVNPISNFPGQGILVYGQKTRQNTVEPTELSRINVARLVIYLRQALARIGTQFVFEQNDSITRNNIAYQIGEFLKGLQAQRAISDYAVVCDLTNNTPATIDANELYVDVAVAPITSAEFIYIPLALVGQGVLSTSSVSAG